MAAPRKRPDLTQSRGGERKRAALMPVAPMTPDASAPFAAPAAWRKATKDSWLAFWSSDVARVVSADHHHAIRRLFEMRDLQSRALDRYRKAPYADGSMGQPVTNPAFAEATKLETQIVALEDRLGLTPKAMANLGIAVGQAAMTAADLNRMAQLPETTLADSDDWTEGDWEAV